MGIDYNIVHAALEAKEVASVAASAKLLLHRLKLQDSDVNQSLSELIDDSEIKSDALCSHLFSSMPEKLQDYLQKCGIKKCHTTLLESKGIGHTCWGQNLVVQLEDCTLAFHIREDRWICDRVRAEHTNKLNIPCAMSLSYISINFYQHNYKL